VFAVSSPRVNLPAHCAESTCQWRESNSAKVVTKFAENPCNLLTHKERTIDVWIERRGMRLCLEIHMLSVSVRMRQFRRVSRD